MRGASVTWMPKWLKEIAGAAMSLLPMRCGSRVKSSRADPLAQASRPQRAWSPRAPDARVQSRSVTGPPGRDERVGGLGGARSPPSQSEEVPDDAEELVQAVVVEPVP